MSTTIDPTTAESVDIETPNGKRFLRRVIRDIRDSKRDWKVTATVDDSAPTYGTDRAWAVTFSYNQKGDQPGDPSFTVTVTTNATIGVDAEDFGDIKEFGAEAGGRERTTAPCPYKFVEDGSGVGRIAQCILDGVSLRIRPNHGSITSSTRGFAAVELVAMYWGTGLSDIVLAHQIYFYGQPAIHGGFYTRD